jgi:hypothetical protein
MRSDFMSKPNRMTTSSPTGLRSWMRFPNRLGPLFGIWIPDTGSWQRFRTLDEDVVKSEILIEILKRMKTWLWDMRCWGRFPTGWWLGYAIWDLEWGSQTDKDLVMGSEILVVSETEVSPPHEDIVWRSEILTEIPKWIRTWLWDMNWDREWI